MYFNSFQLQIKIYFIKNINKIILILENKYVDCHVDASDPNGIIYYEAKLVAGLPTYTIYMKPLGSPATKFNIILNGFYFNTAWR